MRLMKHLTISILLISSWVSFATCYNDVNQNAKYYPALESLLEQNILVDGSFFRPDASVPAKLFWETLLKSAKVDTGYLGDITLPTEINQKDTAVPYLRYAVSKGYIDPENFDSMADMPKDEAIKIMLQIYTIDVRIRSSKKFNKLYAQKIREAGYYAGLFKYVETAMNANILSENDVNLFGNKLTRSDLIQWIYKYQTEGIKPKNARSIQREKIENSQQETPEFKVQFPYQSRNRNAQKNIQKKSTTGRPNISIEIIDNDSAQVSNQSDPASKAENLLRKVMRDLFSNYRFNDELTEAKQEEMVHSAVAGFLEPLRENDKYTRYVQPDQTKEFEEALGSEFEGIGAFVGIEDGDFVIEAPIENSPAERAGLHPGDIVIAVDGDSIVGIELQASIRKIKGPAGSTVELTITRGTEVKKIMVVREKITLETVTFTNVSSVPIIKIHKFEKDTLPKFLELLDDETLTGKERGLIVDLRNNPGGTLQEALKISQEFVKKGEVVMQYDPRDNLQKLISDKDGYLSDIPKIAVLQNKGSASASEILAALLVEKRGAKVFGQKSVGKGTVQTIKPYGSALLKMTTARWLTPDGNWIHEKGIPADYEFENQTYKDREQGIDKARDAAINYILGRFEPAAE
jgi:C-terminal peptidase prc